jgi:hypothetical protein
VLLKQIVELAAEKDGVFSPQEVVICIYQLKSRPVY